MIRDSADVAPAPGQDALAEEQPVRGDDVVRGPPPQHRHQDGRPAGRRTTREDAPCGARPAAGRPGSPPCRTRRRRRARGTTPPARTASASAGAGAARPLRPRRAACPDRACHPGWRTIRASGGHPAPRAVTPGARAARPRTASSTVPVGVATDEPAVPVDRLGRRPSERRAVGQAHRDLGADRGRPAQVVLGQAGGDRVAERRRSSAGTAARRRAGRPAAPARGRPSSRARGASDVPVSGSSSAVVVTFSPTPTTTRRPGALGEDAGELAPVARPAGRWAT